MHDPQSPLEDPAHTTPDDGLDEGFAAYYAEAQRLGKDLNDYLEEDMSWGDCYHLIEPTTFPWMKADSVVLELGAGSGRWSRHLLGRLAGGHLHLVDNSPWKVNFLREYFHAEANVSVHLNDGHTLTDFDDESVDLVCSYGTFIYFQLGQFYRYGQEFFRVLRPGGHVVLDFIDIDTDTGWKWLEDHSSEEWANCFTYYPPDVVEHLFQHVGFEVVKSRDYIEDFNYIVLRKPVH